MDDHAAWEHALDVLMEVGDDSAPDWRTLLHGLSKRDLERLVRSLAYQACMIADELTKAQGGGSVIDVVESIRTHTASFDVARLEE